MLPVVHAARALLVVTPCNLADPVARVAGAVCNLFGALPTGEQPEDLPPAAFIEIAMIRLLVARLGRCCAAQDLCHHGTSFLEYQFGSAPGLAPESSVAS
jgi:hypothetical protein